MAFDHIRVEANADGHGWLVVADSLQAGWEATIDGKRTDLVQADHGVVAVPVPEGTHIIDLRYRPRGRPFTLALTALGLMTVLGMAGAEIRNQRAAKTEELPAADAD